MSELTSISTLDFAERFVNQQDTNEWHVRIATGQEYANQFWINATSVSDPTRSLRPLTAPTGRLALPNLVEMRPPMGGSVWALQLPRLKVPVLSRDVWRVIENKARTLFTVAYVVSPRLIQNILQEMYDFHFAQNWSTREIRQPQDPASLREFLRFASSIDIDIVSTDSGRPVVLNGARGHVEPDPKLWRIINHATKNADGVSIDLALLRETLLVSAMKTMISLQKVQDIYSVIPPTSFQVFHGHALPCSTDKARWALQIHFSRPNGWIAEAERRLHHGPGRTWSILHELTRDDARAALEYLLAVEDKFYALVARLSNYLYDRVAPRFCALFDMMFNIMAWYRHEEAVKALNATLQNPSWQWREHKSGDTVSGRLQGIPLMRKAATPAGAFSLDGEVIDPNTEQIPGYDSDGWSQESGSVESPH